MELPRGPNWQIEHFAKVSTQTKWEFVWGVHLNVVIDKCDPKNHKGASYSILIWDNGQRDEETCSTHHVEPTNPTNFGKCVPSFGMHQFQHGWKPCCDSQIQHGCTLEFFDQFITIRIITMQSIDKVQGASKGNPNTFAKLSYLRQ
jgi:hypothetical protein